MELEAADDGELLKYESIRVHKGLAAMHTDVWCLSDMHFLCAHQAAQTPIESGATLTFDPPLG